MSILGLLNSLPDTVSLHPDFQDAFTAYTDALKAVDKAAEAHRRADLTAVQRESELEAVADRLLNAGDQ